MTVPDEYYLSLSPYLRNTGLAYQVSPLYNPDGERATWTATDKMYDVVTNKFRWGASTHSATAATSILTRRCAAW